MMTMGSKSAAASLVHFNTLPASFWPPRSATTMHWPLSPLPSLSASPFNSPCKINAGSGLNVLEGGKPNVLEGVDTVLEDDDSDEFVEVGLIRNTHGVRGEVKVTSHTDFPEQRFEKAGIRWVGYYRSGKLVGIHEIELLSGRKIIQGKESTWLLTFRGFDTLEKASELLGARLLVKNADRPMLSADQFYIPELIGMSVQLKDSGKVIGSIVDIFNSGANDLLRVKLSQPRENVGGRDDDSLVWIPFVEEIVPVVDQQARMVQIVPPQGLLELNLPSKRPLKQELRKQALKTKRKLQERMSGVRKKVLALKQAHILSGLTLGDEFQRETLKAQLLDIDFSSFKRAMETSLKDSELSLDSDAFSFTSAIASSLDWKGLKDWLEASPKKLEHSNKVNKLTWRSWLQGLQLVANGKVAVVALPSGDSAWTDAPDVSLESNLECQAGQILALQELAKIISGGKPLIPWVVVITEDSGEYIKNLLKDEAYFGLTEGQVHFVKLSCLPYISHDAAEGVQRVLMESQWRIVAGAGGDGQVISDLDDSGVLNTLMGMGIDYIHVCSLDNSSVINMDPAIFGFMEERKACIALKVTSEALEGHHGILYLQKGSVDGRSRSIFISTLEEAAEVRKNSASAFEHYAVLKSGESMKADFPVLKDDEVIYRVASSCNYTLSAEYLRHLSQQRHGFVYEAERKTLSHKESSEDGDIGNESLQNNVIQFKCSLHNALLFCSPSKVALLKYDGLV